MRVVTRPNCLSERSAAFSRASECPLLTQSGHERVSIAACKLTPEPLDDILRREPSTTREACREEQIRVVRLMPKMRLGTNA